MPHNYRPPRPPTLEEVRKQIHAKVKRDLTQAIVEVAGVIQKYALSENEFLAIADNMIRSYDIIREQQEKMKGKPS